MATLDAYFGQGFEQNKTHDIWVDLVVWLQVGSGRVTHVSPYRAGYAGKIHLLLYKGIVYCELELLDRDPHALSGPARVALNGKQASSASYQVENDALVIQAVFARGQGQTIRIVPGGRQDRETYLNLSGAYDYEVHLTPA